MNNAITLLFAALLLFSPFANAHEAHCEDTKLGDTMNQMKKAYKQLRKSASKENYSRAQELTKQLRRLSKEARELTPLKKKEDPELSVEDYRTAMSDMDESLGTLLIALEKQNQDKIESLISQLNKLKKSGHKKYRLECE